MIEITREWLNKGIWEKFIGFAILFIASYGIIWGLVEPLISADIVVRFFGNETLKYWWKYQLIISSLISAILFLWLLPTKVLYTFGTESQDTDMLKDYTSEGTPEISIVDDGYYGDVYSIKGNFDNDSLNWMINPDEYAYVSYIYQPSSKFALYLKISVTSNNDTKEKPVWIVLRTDISIPKRHGDGSEEWAYPVKGKIGRNGWLVSYVRVSEAAKKTFGTDSRKYKKLIGIRIRGVGKIQKILFMGRLF